MKTLIQLQWNCIKLHLSTQMCDDEMWWFQPVHSDTAHSLSLFPLKNEKYIYRFICRQNILIYKISLHDTGFSNYRKKNRKKLTITTGMIQDWTIFSNMLKWYYMKIERGRQTLEKCLPSRLNRSEIDMHCCHLFSMNMKYGIPIIHQYV